jgi:hypothetical protein
LTDALAPSVIPRLAVELESKVATSLLVGTAVFQLVSVSQTESVAPVQVYVSAMATGTMASKAMATAAPRQTATRG